MKLIERKITVIVDSTKELFLKSAGMWSDIDAEALKRRIRERRKAGTSPRRASRERKMLASEQDTIHKYRYDILKSMNGTKGGEEVG